MTFRKVTANKYIGQDGFNLVKCSDGTFSICKGSTVTKWGTGFRTVRSAENFLESRDYIQATTNKLPIEQDDLKFIDTVYAGTWSGNQFISDTFTLTIPPDFKKTHKLRLKSNAKEDQDKLIDDIQDLLLELDRLEVPLFASVSFRGVELRPILAKSDRKSTREIVRNLIRVKSSNIWSYGVEVNNNQPDIGDVYVQFKGKNGGPDDVYRYYDVPLKLWRKFISAPSKGHFLWKYLRNNFLYSKLTGDKRGKLKNAVN